MILDLFWAFKINISIKLNVLNSAAARNEIYFISIFAYCKQELSKGYLDDKRIC